MLSMIVSLVIEKKIHWLKKTQALMLSMIVLLVIEKKIRWLKKTWALMLMMTRLLKYTPMLEADWLCMVH